MSHNRPDEDLDRIDAVLAFEGCLHLLLVCILALAGILLLTWFARTS